MKLYYSPGACSLAVRIIIHELGLNAEYEAVDFRTKKTASGVNYFTINPKGNVPTIITDDNQTLTENVAIQIYLAEKNNAPQLFPPPSDFKRYRVLEWLAFITSDLHKRFGMLFNPKIPNEVKDNVLKSLIKEGLTFVNNAIKQNKYLIGEQFTLPDAYLFVILTWMPNFKLDINEYPNLARYFAELKKRNTIVQSLKEENLHVET